MQAFSLPSTVQVTHVRYRGITARRRPVFASLASPVAAARARLLNAISGTSKDGGVAKALQELIDVAPEAEVTDGWDSAVTGRWGLRYTTEPPLARLLELGETKSYQLFRGNGGVVEVCFLSVVLDRD